MLRIRSTRIAAVLRDAAERHREQHPGSDSEWLLNFPGLLSESKITRAIRSCLKIRDGSYQRAKVQQFGIHIPSRVALEDPETIGPEIATRYTHDLLYRLHGIEPGQAGWSAYEKYCGDLLNFLFVPPLSPALPQSRDDRRANRRDYILPNHAPDGFWQLMRDHYGAYYVVAEVKNLRGCPGKREFLQVANYLNPHGTGLFALVLARKEPDETARWICREQWVQHHKLIVGINDEDVHQMVETRLAGSDPAELILQKIDNFRLGI